MSPTHNVGTRCWIQDKQEGWVSATVRDRKIEGDKLVLELECENGQTVSVTAPADADNDENHPGLPPLRNPPLLDTTEDLTDLSYLNEPSVLHAIRVRYSQLNIYTYSGIVLIATNPFQKIDSLYTSDIIQAYSGKQKGQLEPHLFAIAEDAYACMIREDRNQTIVVSGESGAGKTVSAKYIMRYFATVEPPDQAASSASLRKDHQMTETETQILATNPIMESFGNAKTTRNDNSSRFGKYIEILFDKSLDIIGAQIKTYLLERSRLVFQAPTERNYHIFYQLLAGISDDERTTFGLESVEQFNYLNQGGDHIISGVDDAAEFQATKDALDTIGISKETQHQLFTILAALLHIGNIQIGDRRDAHLPSDEPSLVKACQLLGLDPTQFAKWVTKKQIITRGEKIISNLNGKQAYVVRDSVSKFVYSILFDWLVWKINHGLATPEVQARAKSRIGVLDIYGFEHFKHNSFEQFCINYANEKLQQEFNRYVFKLEQDEYIKEQIPWTFIEFSDNQPCIDLIEAKLGILSLLDEESRLPSGSDGSWVQKLYNNFDNEAHHAYFKKPRFGKTSFTVNHYAMEVEYDSEGFIEKNRDTVPDEQLEVLKLTSNDLLKEILETAADKAGMSNGDSKSGTSTGTSTPTPGRVASNRKPTLGGIFKSSLIDLMRTIESTKVHYIRCIKPNETKTAWQFDGPMVLSQLRACGVLETIRISCEGFPTRWTFEEFVNRYYMLVSSENWNGNIRDIVTVILENTVTGPNKYQIGVSKIFFRAGMLAYLENRRTERLNECAILIQKNLRRFYYRKRYLEIRNEMILLQSCIRGYLARKRAQALRELFAATKIQSFWRGTSQRKEYLATREKIIWLQAVTRGYLVRKDLRNIRFKDAALLIQKTWRGFHNRKDFVAYRKKVILVQCCIRRRQARKELDALKIEARSADHFKSVSYQLENKVVELTQLLDSVRSENKSLQTKIDRYDAEIGGMRENHRQLKESNSQLEEDALRANFHENKSKELEEQLNNLTQENNKLQGEIEQSSLRVAELERNLQERESQVEKSREIISGKEEENMVLRGDLERLQDEYAQLEARKGGAMSNGDIIPQHFPAGANLVSLSSGGKRERTGKRRSLNQAILERGLEESPIGVFDPRPASMAVGTKMRGSNVSQSSGSSLLSVDSEMERLLDNEVVLYPEIMRGVIENMKIPAITREKIGENQVFVPAHIINLVIKEMWRLGMVKESERFLAMVLQKIQDQVLRFEDNEEIILQGPFWLSNVHEIYSFACLAEANISHSDISDELSEIEYKEYARLVSVVKHDLLNLEFNIYHTMMKTIKKRINSMIIPAVIESQSLPGFMTNEGSRFFKMLTSTPQYNMDDLLKYLSHIHFVMKSFYIESVTIEGAIVELFQLIGVVGFNDLLMRRNFLSWKRGLQISYNLTRMEEWCQTNGVAEGLLRLESLMQCAKLLQLKKDTIEDIDVIFDICWKLTPAQIQKIVNQYHVADYEEPIDGEFLKKIAIKAQQSKQDKLLLESTPLDDSGPFDAAEPREITHLDSYVPAWLQTPSIKKLAELASSSSSSQIV